MLTSRGLGTVLGDLSEMGFDAEWGVLSAADVGANHRRERIWIVGKMVNSNSRSVKTFCKPGILEQSDFEGEANRYSHGSNKKNVGNTQGKNESHVMADSTNARQLRAQLVESNSRSERRRQSQTYFDKKSEIHGKKMAHSNSTRCEELRNSSKRGAKEISVPSFQSWWATEPNVGRVANGVAARVDRLKAIGNGQVPLCAATAFKLLKERLK